MIIEYQKMNVGQLKKELKGLDNNYIVCLFFDTSSLTIYKEDRKDSKVKEILIPSEYDYKNID
jgi:hypothetical protein